MTPPWRKGFLKKNLSNFVEIYAFSDLSCSQLISLYHFTHLIPGGNKKGILSLLLQTYIAWDVIRPDLD